MILTLKPIDVLFFRDSKPFGRGSEHFSKSIFPPFPQTLYGALRTKVLEQLGCDYESFAKGKIVFKNMDMLKNLDEDKVRDELGSVDLPGAFTLKGPLLMYNNEAIYIKLPADIKVESLNGNRNYRILEPFDWGKFNVQTDLEHLSCFPHFANETPLRDVNGYISMPKLINSYLLCDTEITGTDIKQPNEIFEYEERTGLKIDSGLHVAEEGMVYTIQVIRLRDRFSLYASAENISALAERGFIKFGGMNRVCEYEILDNDPLKKYYDQKEKEIKNLVSKTKIFKMLFLTPAVFNGGWWFNSNNYEINFNGLKFKLLSAVINKPLFISGWDLANNKPKPLKKVVPEGSVYYFELIEGSVDDLFQKFNFVNFGDENPNLGYGLTLIGGIKNV